MDGLERMTDICSRTVPPLRHSLKRTTGAGGLKELSPEELLAEDEDSEDRYFLMRSKAFLASRNELLRHR